MTLTVYTLSTADQILRAYLPNLILPNRECNLHIWDVCEQECVTTIMYKHAHVATWLDVKSRDMLY